MEFDKSFKIQLEFIWDSEKTCSFCKYYLQGILTDRLRELNFQMIN